MLLPNKNAVWAIHIKFSSSLTLLKIGEINISPTFYLNVILDAFQCIFRIKKLLIFYILFHTRALKSREYVHLDYISVWTSHIWSVQGHVWLMTAVMSQPRLPTSWLKPCHFPSSAHTPSSSKRRYQVFLNGPHFTHSVAWHLSAPFSVLGFSVLSWFLAPAMGWHCLGLNLPLTTCNQRALFASFESLRFPILETGTNSVFPRVAGTVRRWYSWNTTWLNTISKVEARTLGKAVSPSPAHHGSWSGLRKHVLFSLLSPLPRRDAARCPELRTSPLKTTPSVSKDQVTGTYFSFRKSLPFPTSHPWETRKYSQGSALLLWCLPL